MMKLTLQIQLFPDTSEAAQLKATVERFNKAANWLAGEAFARKVANKILLQKLCYRELRDRFALPADTAVRCIAQVCEASKRDKAKRPKFRTHAAVPFSMGKNLSFKGPEIPAGLVAYVVIVSVIIGRANRNLSVVLVDIVRMPTSTRPGIFPSGPGLQSTNLWSRNG